MPRLKDYLASDLETMFNTDDFSTTHNINGVSMVAIVDEDLLKERQRKSNDPDGIYLGDTLIHVAVTEYAKCGGSRLTPGEQIEMDNKPYRVTDCQEDDGMYSITLAAYQS